MRPGDLVRLKNEFEHDMEFGVSMLPSPAEYLGSAVGHFEGTHVGILLDYQDGGETCDDSHSLVLVGDCVGWVYTIDLEVVP